jgi:uncharacterized protein YfiM (DUF2279 family)
MKRISIIVIIILWFNTISAQIFWDQDSLPNKKRIGLTSVAVATVGGGSLTGLAAIWYKNNWNPDGFSFFNDGKEWLQMDKLGHFYTAHHIAAGLNKTYKWSGINDSKSRFIGSLISLGYLTTIEILDGFSKDYGFSWWDVAANTAGVSWFLAQEQLWREQRIHLKFSASLSPYAQFRPSHLGRTVPERILKDYNGQTYWASFSPAYFFSKQNHFPKWLAVSFGYSVEQKLHGFEDEFLVQQGNKLYHFSAQRQYLLSLDIDLTKLPIERKWLKTVAYALNHLKIPFPTLIFGENITIYGKWAYF